MSRSGVPLSIGADPPEFDDPFAILEACHGRIARMLRTLERLGPHVAARGVDDEAREAIARVRRYFEIAGPDHHADEEVDLFPIAREAARAVADDAGLAAIDALERDHREMERGWAGLRDHLDALVVGAGPVAVDAARVAAFVSLYRDHVRREEDGVYATAKARLGASGPSLQAMAAAMVARRRR